MDKDLRFVKCYTGAYFSGGIDPMLAANDFARGVILFAIPDYGILFRCRAHGSLVDLEFGAFFGLLRFIKTHLGEEGIKAVKVLSSNPEFVFAFTGKSRHLTGNQKREKLLREYSREFTMAMAYIKRADNKVFLSPADFPSMPAGARVRFQPRQFANRKPRIRPFYRGIDL